MAYNITKQTPNKPFRHLSFRVRSDLNTRLFRPGLIESTYHAQWVGSLAIVGLGSFSGENQSTELLISS